MAEPRFIDVFVDANPFLAEGCGLRWKSDREPRRIATVRYDDQLCAIAGWSSEGGGSACAAQAIVVEDSGSGSALLVYGGDWGLRLSPAEGAPFFEAYLLLELATELG